MSGGAQMAIEKSGDPAVVHAGDVVGVDQDRGGGHGACWTDVGKIKM